MSEITTIALLLELQRRVASVYLGSASDDTLKSLSVTTIKELHRTLKSSKDQLVKQAEDHE
jgi:hypothetical protein